MPRPHPRLLRAFRRTIYAWCGLPVRIGRRDRGLDAALGGRACAAFLTAWNPMSHRMPAGRNIRAQRSLREAARRSVQGGALAGAGTWWEEPMIVLRTDPRAAERLARRFRQHAIVILRRGAKPRLRVLPRLP